MIETLVFLSLAIGVMAAGLAGSMRGMQLDMAAEVQLGVLAANMAVIEELTVTGYDTDYLKESNFSQQNGTYKRVEWWKPFLQRTAPKYKTFAGKQYTVLRPSSDVIGSNLLATVTMIWTAGGQTYTNSLSRKIYR